MSLSSLELSRVQIKQIAKDTIGQASNNLWHKMRKNRLTASQFGKAIRAYDYGTTNAVKEVIETVKGERTIPSVAPILWGKDHEKDAIEKYSAIKGYNVRPTGLWIFPNGYLAASPDGIVFEDEEMDIPSGIIEVKCPYSVRFMDFYQMRQQKKLPMYLNANGNLKINADHYHQIQGELVATGAPWCDFIVWTTIDIKIQRIFPNLDWKLTYIPKLTSFYIENILSQHLQMLTLKGMSRDNLV